MLQIERSTEVGGGQIRAPIIRPCFTRNLRTDTSRCSMIHLHGEFQTCSLLFVSVGTPVCTFVVREAQHLPKYAHVHRHPLEIQI